MGAETAAKWREAQARQAELMAQAAPAPPPPDDPIDEEDGGFRSAFREALPATVFAIVAAVVVAAIAAALEARVLSFADFADLLSVAAGPIALVGILYLLLFRTSRREARRFGQTASAMRREAATMERVLATLSTRIEENRVALSGHAQQLLALGESASGRLADIGMTMRAEAAALSRQSDKLDEAASTARADLGVLLSDLPRAEAQTRAVADVLRDAGLGAHEHAAALEAQLSALAARGREADESAGGAAQRLAAHLARIDGTSEVAARRMDEAAVRMTSAIDTTLGEASRAVDEVRKGIDGQQDAIRAMIGESGAAFERAGADAAGALVARLSAIGGHVDALGERLARQDSTVRDLADRLGGAMAEVETRFAALDEGGSARAAALGAAITALREEAARMGEALERGDDTADALIARTDTLKASLAAAAHEMAVGIPAALTRIEEQAAGTHAALSLLGPQASAVETAAAATADWLREADAALDRQQAALAALAENASARIATIREQGDALERLVETTARSTDMLAESAAPKLVDALLRVHETAQAASERARDALAAVIPDAARALGQASGTAMEAAVRERVTAQLAAVGAAAERAVAAADAATERLAAQVATIGETTDAMEARIAETRAEAEERDEDNFSRRVALLIESLNSAAIDVTKILSNEVTDGAWAAYLKGDRGIFTRRAVRLLDATEAREIARHYEEEAEFRGQVNRYVHDFEGMLRRVLATREGNALGVTILSSDMGKLYVALAQAIERLRT